MILNLMKDELRRDEGLRLKPYKDSVGKVTIGIGRNLDDVGISENEADIMLTNDIVAVINFLDMSLPWWKNMTEVRQRALLNMTFNVGRTSLLGFRNMLDALRTEDYALAAHEALDSKWASQVGARATRIAEAFAG